MVNVPFASLHALMDGLNEVQIASNNVVNKWKMLLAYIKRSGEDEATAGMSDEDEPGASDGRYDTSYNTQMRQRKELGRRTRELRETAHRQPRHGGGGGRKGALTHSDPEAVATTQKKDSTIIQNALKEIKQ